MDRLQAYVLILHAKVERERLRRRVAFLEQQTSWPMTPKLAAIKQQLALLHSDVDTESQNALNQIEAARARTKTVFAGTREKIGKAVQKVHAQVDEVNSFLDDLEKSNGGPTLDGSEQPLPEPQKSWSGNGQG